MLISAGIVALIAILFIGTPNDLNLTAIEKYVKKEVLDESRRNEIKVELKEVKKLQKAYNKETKTNTKELSSLVNTYQTTAADFDTFFDKLVTYENTIGEKFIPIRLKVQSLITQEEWDQILVSMEKDMKKDTKAKEKQFEKYKSELEKGKAKILKNIETGKQAEAEKILDAFNQTMISFSMEVLNMNSEDMENIMNKNADKTDLLNLIEDNNEEWLGLLQGLSKLNTDLKKLVPEDSWKPIANVINKHY